MPQISVIIPVYNTAPYLPRCLDSVLSQTFGDIEIICVDDGSTDGSVEILKSYEEKDSRIKIISQQNKYAGAARNAGLCQAVGEYVIFWDSDDYFKDTALEELYTRAQYLDADMCICNAQDFDSESGSKLYHNYLRPPLPETEVFNMESFPIYFFTFTAPVVWNKLIRRSIFTENGIAFDNLKHINDVMGTFLAMAYAKRIVLLNKKLMFYTVNRSQSLMDTYGEQADAVFLAYSRLKDELERRKLLNNSEIRHSFCNKVWDIFVFTARYCNSYANFKLYMEKLKNEWLPAFDMLGLSKEYFYNADRGWQYEALFAQTSGEFLFELFCFQSDLSKKRNQTAMQRGARVRSLRRQNDQQLDTITALEKRVAELQEKNRVVNGKLQKKDEKIEKLRRKAAKKDEKIEKLRCSVSKKDKTIVKLRGRLEKEKAVSAKRGRLLNRRLVRLALKISSALGAIKKKFKNGR